MSWRSRQKGISLQSACRAVQKNGILLVYPINNRPLPLSLWSCFFPRTKMRWVWDETGDGKVVQMWDLRERMSRSTKVVYSKWYQGRATFFAPKLFSALLSAFHRGRPSQAFISHQGRQLMDLLLDNSPQTTKTLKKRVKRELGWLNPQYNQVMKELWHKCLIVGSGEVDDGAFPSLNVGATQLLWEDLWAKAHVKDVRSWDSLIEAHLPVGSLWRKNFDKIFMASEHCPTDKTKAKIYYKDLVSKRS